ncbi:MarR family winged helix-turn-helix transcriptional regulator [Caballeronia mineralivorans]|jgi:DNA-binding MarR family transcriptional regulator|uniref:MarR family winged helix-turn-helix transcriptional regulator n=1 Tax=Caballeronia mineralivorans TaxID=2010198 RepID=UPI002B003B0E|nr:MarR family winged helix-turn-helix transcriptional regulator [Caballeronia mineralivorans]MEA3102241.1 hypothetical protein [Caballeronia mineralivorans]
MPVWLHLNAAPAADGDKEWSNMKSNDTDPTVAAIAQMAKLSLNHLFAQRAMRAFSAHFNEALRPAGVTALQFCMLASLHGKQPLVFGDMAAELVMDRSHLSSHLAPLFRGRLVSIVPDNADRRTRQLALTPHGRIVLAESMALWSEAYANAFEIVKQVDLDSLRSLFFAFNDRNQHTIPIR